MTSYINDHYSLILSDCYNFMSVAPGVHKSCGDYRGERPAHTRRYHSFSQRHAVTDTESLW